MIYYTKYLCIYVWWTVFHHFQLVSMIFKASLRPTQHKIQRTALLVNTSEMVEQCSMFCLVIHKCSNINAFSPHTWHNQKPFPPKDNREKWKEFTFCFSLSLYLNRHLPTFQDSIMQSVVHKDFWYSFIVHFHMNSPTKFGLC